MTCNLSGYTSNLFKGSSNDIAQIMLVECKLASNSYQANELFYTNLMLRQKNIYSAIRQSDSVVKCIIVIFKNYGTLSYTPIVYACFIDSILTIYTGYHSRHFITGNSINQSKNSFMLCNYFLIYNKMNLISFLLLKKALRF